MRGKCSDKARYILAAVGSPRRHPALPIGRLDPALFTPATPTYPWLVGQYTPMPIWPFSGSGRAANPACGHLAILP